MGKTSSKAGHLVPALDVLEPFRVGELDFGKLLNLFLVG